MGDVERSERLRVETDEHNRRSWVAIRMATARLLPMVELAAGDELPFYVCSCPCIEGPCEHGPETWTVARVETFYAGQQVEVTFTNGRQEKGGRGRQLVAYERSSNPHRIHCPECTVDAPCSSCASQVRAEAEWVAE